MKVVIVDKTSCAVVALHSVTSITWQNDTTTIVGISYAGDGSVQTFTAHSNRYVVRIIEN